MSKPLAKYDVIIIGAGAAGLFCAIEAARRGRHVMVLDKAEKAGKKILISGGGRCNFTNLHIDPDAYLSVNPHFCKSALARYTQWDFIAKMDQHQLTWHEKTLGQLFCDDKAPAVLNMLLSECRDSGVDFQFNAKVEEVVYQQQYRIVTGKEDYQSPVVVVATGGPSIPKMGATDFGVQLATQFDLKSVPFSPALVPLTFHPQDIKRYFEGLSGLSVDAQVSCHEASFREGLLITHRGFSGPAILQISSYWRPGDELTVNLLPDLEATTYLLDEQQKRGKSELKTVLSVHLPRRFSERLANTLLDNKPLASTPLAQIKSRDLQALGEVLNRWCLRPSGTEGLRTAEVCLGGVHPDELSSKTMESRKQSGLYFIGETVDVTGWLGGYNFQWAWSSGWVAGQHV
jgi:predicted Rossmann fold flavoprotein